MDILGVNDLIIFTISYHNIYKIFYNLYNYSLNYQFLLASKRKAWTPQSECD